jgi:hypothetical protein
MFLKTIGSIYVLGSRVWSAFGCRNTAHRRNQRIPFQSFLQKLDRAAADLHGTNDHFGGCRALRLVPIVVPEPDKTGFLMRNRFDEYYRSQETAIRVKSGWIYLVNL